MHKFRYALALPGETAPAWQLAACHALAASGLAVAIGRVDLPLLSPSPAASRLARRLTGATNTERPVALTAPFASLAPIERDTPLDFILQLGDQPVDTSLASRAAHGVWAFDLGTAPGFFEMLRGDRVVCAHLLQHSTQGSNLLYSGSVRIVPESLAATRGLAQSVCRDFLVKACRDLHQGVTFAPHATVPSPALPGRTALLRFLLRDTRAKLRAKYEWLFRHEQWGVGIIDLPIDELLQHDVCPPAQWIANDDRERFIADPAGVIEEHGYGVFVEDLEQRAYRGKVTYYHYHPDSGFDGPTDVLTEGHHLSYPYIIEHDGHRYCLPEMAAANEVALYEITDYPGGWEKVATLLPDYAALDSTVFQHEDRWWMFSATRVASGAYSLVAFYADDLFGPWQPHARNPLSTDIATSRPGGQPFLADGRLIRPAQDCSRTYGGALALMHVTELTPETFAETLLRVVEPNPNDPYNDGFHTVFPLGERTLIDGKRRILIPYLLKKALGLA